MPVKRTQTFSTIFSYGLCAYALLLPLFIKGMPVLLTVLIISLALSAKKGEIGRSWRSWSSVQRALLLGLPVYYLFHLIGMAWSADMDFALLDIGIKVSLFLLPVLLVFVRISQEALERVMQCFVLGALLSVAWNLILSGLSYATSGDPMDFQGSVFSHTLHIGYYAMYLCVAIAILLHGMLTRGRGKAWPKWAALMILVIAILLTASKMGAIVLFVLFLTALLMFIRLRGEWKRGLLLAAALAGLIAISFSASSMLEDRVVTMWQRTFNSPIEPSSVESTMARRMTWRSTWELAKEHPLLGTGTGDIKNELVRTYMENGFIGPAEARLNSHNQYLQSYAALGIFGGSALLLTMLGVLALAWQSGQFLAIGGSLSMALCLITESALEVQAGVLFVGFMLPLLVHWTALHRIKT